MRDIDPQKIANEQLDWFEWRYLKDRGRLPVGYAEPEKPEEEPEDFPKSRITPLEEQSVPSMDDDTELPETSSSSKVTPLEDQSELEMGNNGGIVSDDDDEEEDYEDGWNNDQRRAELSKRGLSVDGKKDDLIARLRRSDNDELTDEDSSDLDD